MGDSFIMVQLYHLITPYRCKLCGQDMLFFETKRGTLIDYKPFISKGYSLEQMISFLESKGVKFLYCTRCQRSFIIDWRNGWPEQLIHLNPLKEFGV